MNLPRLSMVHGLFGALVVCAAFAVYESTSASPADAALAPPAPKSSIALPTDDISDTQQKAPSSIEGEVLEVLDVPQYTYARLSGNGGEGTWTAFNSTKVTVGQHLKLGDAVLMTDFSSKILKRTFPTIWFGNLEAGNAALPENPHAAMMVTMGASEASPTGSSSAVAVTMHPVDKASGPDGKTVAEIIAGRAELSGKKVRVRGIVVKKTSGVLGHDYLHLRDGSGDQAAHTNDLSVTTETPVSLGDTILIDGILRLDVDIGSGYTFPTLLEGAQLVVP